jgi:lipopolysaccharide export system permease protein
MASVIFKQVDKLVAVAVLSAVGLVWLLLVGFDAMRAFVLEANDIGQGQYTVTKAVAYVLLTVPRRGYEMFGNAALIGSLMGLGTLAASNELTAMRAAGLSKLRICASVVLALLLLTAAVTLIGETIGPIGEQRAQTLALRAKSKDIAIGKSGGLWAHDGDTVVGAQRGRARSVSEGSVIELSEVRIFEFSPTGKLTALSFAKSAIHQNGQWTLQDVHRTDFAEAGAVSKDEKETHWESGLDPRVLALSVIHPEYLSARDLWRNVQYKQRNREDASGFEAVFWRRIFYPLNVLVLAFCAVPFAFGALRSGGLAKRLFVGMVLAIIFYLTQNTLVSMGTVYGFNLAFSNALPALLLASGAIIYFRRYG